MIRSLRRKFIAVTMAIVTVLLCAMLGFVIHTSARSWEHESISALRMAVEEPLGHGRPGERPTPCFVVRVSPWGQSIQSTGGFDLSDEAFLTEIVALAASAEEPMGILEGYRLRYYRQEYPGGLTLAFADISAERSAVRQLTLSCIGIGTAAIAVFWALSILLARWATRPVERAWEEQRQFVADASHELKTPLTVILTNAELLDSQTESQYSHSILTMGQRMRTLVESLLELARVDGGTARDAFGEIDLSALAEEELLPFEPVFFEQGLTLESEIEPGLSVRGSDRHLRQLLGILLDNALKYSLPGGCVFLALTRQSGNALLTVSNPGEPMSREECRNIFRRFYRTDKARTAGGYGLGLPIARGIAENHGGRLRAECRDGKVVFHFQLPLFRKSGTTP